MASPAQIIVDGPAWIGDMVMAQSLFKLIKMHHPEVSLDVLAPPWTQSLLSRMPEVRQIFTVPFHHGDLKLKQRYQLAKSLRKQHYDQAIVLRNSFKSALIPYWAKIPRRTGWLGEWRYGLLNDWRKLDKSRYPLMIERFMALALAKDEPLPCAHSYPYPQLVINPAGRLQTLGQLQLAWPKQPVLALCPGAEYGPAKRWPLVHFAEVAKTKLQEGWQVWLFGSQKDREITDKINALCDFRCSNLAGQTELNQAIDLLSLAHLVVTNDSGLMHVSAALDRPLLALYGSSSNKFTPPLGRQVSILSLNLACSPCFKRECPLQHMRCLSDLKPDTVLRAMQNLLATEMKSTSMQGMAHGAPFHTSQV